MISKIDESLVRDLIGEYKEIKRSYNLRQYELAISKFTKFSETVFQILKYLVSGEVIDPKDIKFNDIERELSQTRRGDYPESIRVIIPRITIAAYTIRSKRGAVHKSNEISPDYIDCSLIVNVCDWTVAEFLRLYSTLDPQKIEEILCGLIEKKVPIIEEVSGDVIVLEEGLSATDEILLILYYSYPKNVELKNLKKWIKYQSSENILTSAKNLDKKRLIHYKNKECKLTKKGIKFVETNYRDHLR